MRLWLGTSGCQYRDWRGPASPPRPSPNPNRAVIAPSGPPARAAAGLRADSGFTEATYDLLRDHDAALVLADRKSHQSPLVRTAGWTFVRFHEGAAHPRPRSGDSALATWVDRLRGDDEAWVFFNNDPGCWAVEN